MRKYVCELCWTSEKNTLLTVLILLQLGKILSTDETSLKDPFVPTLREHSTMLWLLYELFGAEVNDGNCPDVVELAFALLEPRIRRRAMKNGDESAENQRLNEDRKTLRAFIAINFQAQMERTRKGKASMDEFNGHFREFVNGLEELNIVSEFDANTNIFENVSASNDEMKESVCGNETVTSAQFASFDKHLVDMWGGVTTELALAAQIKIAQPQQHSPKKSEILLNRIFSTFLQQLSEYLQTNIPTLGEIFRPHNGGNMSDDKRRLNLFALEHWNGKLRLILKLSENICAHLTTSNRNRIKERMRRLKSTSKDLRKTMGKALKPEKLRKRPTVEEAVKKLFQKQSVGRGKQPFLSKNYSKIRRPKKGQGNFCALKSKMAKIVSIVGALRTVFTRTEVRKSRKSSKETRRNILLDFARQKTSLYDSSAAVNCHKNAALTLFDRIELRKIIKLTEAIKSVNHLVFTELQFAAKKRQYSVNDSHAALNAILVELCRIETGTNAINSAEERGREATSHSNLAQTHLQIDLLCTILHDLEHNAMAFRALIECDGEDIVAEFNPSNLAKNHNANDQRQKSWWTVLESALTVLQYEIYSTIVRLSNVNWKFRQHEQARWNALDNVLRDTKYVSVAQTPMIQMPTFSSFHRLLNTFFRFDQNKRYPIHYILHLIFEHKSKEIAQNKHFGKEIADELSAQSQSDAQFVDRMRALTICPMKIEKKYETMQIKADENAERQLWQINEFVLPNSLLLKHSESISRAMALAEDKFGAYTPIDFSRLLPFGLFYGPNYDFGELMEDAEQFHQEFSLVQELLSGLNPRTTFTCDLAQIERSLPLCPSTGIGQQLLCFNYFNFIKLSKLMHRLHRFAFPRELSLSTSAIYTSHLSALEFWFHRNLLADLIYDQEDAINVFSEDTLTNWTLAALGRGDKSCLNCRSKNDEKENSALIAHRRKLIELAVNGVFHRCNFHGGVNISRARSLIVAISRSILRSRMNNLFNSKSTQWQIVQTKKGVALGRHISFMLMKSIADLHELPEWFGHLLDALFQSGELAVEELKLQNQSQNQSKLSPIAESSSASSNQQNGNLMKFEELNNAREELVFFVLNIFRIELTNSLVRK